MLQYSLGSFTFIKLASFTGPAGAPMLPRNRGEIVQRMNVQGTGFVIGQRNGSPFPMQSIVDVQSDAEAHFLMSNYYLSVLTDPLTLVWRGVDYFDTFGVRFVVYDISDVMTFGVAAATGGLSDSPAGCLVATWHLVPVEVSQ